MLPYLYETDALHTRDVIVTEQDSRIPEIAFPFDILIELFFKVVAAEFLQDVLGHWHTSLECHVYVLPLVELRIQVMKRVDNECTKCHIAQVQVYAPYKSG